MRFSRLPPLRYNETTQKLENTLHEIELLQKEVEHLKEKLNAKLKEEQHKNEVLTLKYELLKSKYNIKDEQ
jgi:FtsZ-binding cell division protein ZapB